MERAETHLDDGPEDPEPVHQARVAVRRMRSDLRTFAPLLDERWARDLGRRLRWLGDGFAAARDADVLLARVRRLADGVPVTERPALHRVLATLESERAAAYGALAAMRRDERYALLHAEIASVPVHPRFTRRAGEPAEKAIGTLMDAAWCGLRTTVRQRSRPPTDAELHAIRIGAKRVRYAAEAMVPCAGAPATAFARQAERLQTVLGEQHDAVVSAARLRDLAAPDAIISVEEAAMVAGRHAWRACWRAIKPRPAHFW